jgi:hypothetical protein
MSCEHEFRGSNTLVPRPEEIAYTVIVPCISCEALCEHNADAPILVCPTCHTQWVCERWRTTDELVELIRALLDEHTDASRRAFYNSQSLLFQIAQAVDACPKKA